MMIFSSSTDYECLKFDVSNYNNSTLVSMPLFSLLCGIPHSISPFSLQPPVWSHTCPTGSWRIAPVDLVSPTRIPSTSDVCRSSKRHTTRRQSARTERGRIYRNVCQVIMYTHEFIGISRKLMKLQSAMSYIDVEIAKDNSNLNDPMITSIPNE